MGLHSRQVFCNVPVPFFCVAKTKLASKLLVQIYKQKTQTSNCRRREQTNVMAMSQGAQVSTNDGTNRPTSWHENINTKAHGPVNVCKEVVFALLRHDDNLHVEPTRCQLLAPDGPCLKTRMC